MAKHWYMEFDVGQWMTDPAVGRCSAATRGIWFDWLCAMFKDDRSGVLIDVPERLAQLGRCSVREAKATLAELAKTAAAIVLNGANGVVTLINRRMARDFVERKKSHFRQLRSRNQPIPDDVQTLVTLLDTELSRNSSPLSNSKPKEQKAEGRDSGDDEQPADPTWLDEVWAEWSAYKAERHEGYKPAGERAARGKLQEMGEVRARAAVAHSMANNWAGFFEPKPNGKQQPPAPAATVTPRSNITRAPAGFQFGKGAANAGNSRG